MLVRRRTEIVSILAILALAAGMAFLFVNHHIDRSFITYRYARNLAAGRGFAFNPGQPDLSSAVAPLYVFLLSIGADFAADLPLLSNTIGALAVALGGLAMFGIALPKQDAPPAGEKPPARSGLDVFTAALAAGVYVVLPLLWVSLGLETALWMALGLGALWLHQRGWGTGAALLLAFATLMRPEIGALAVVLVADSVLNGRPVRLLPGGLYAGVVVFGVVLMSAAVNHGGPLPGLPVALPGVGLPDAIGATVFTGLPALMLALGAASPLWAAGGLLALIGLLRLSKESWALRLAAWAVLSLIVLGIARAAVYPWSFAPLAPALAALIALGARWLIERLRQVGCAWQGARCARC